MKPLLVTPGDPKGVGPEVVCRALASRPELRCELIGDRAALVAAARGVGVALDVPITDPGDADEPVEVASLRLAVERLLAGDGAALVTGPIHKARLARRGFRHTGHTDFLGHLCGIADPVMAFVGGRVVVALATVHLPLRAVPDALDGAAILRATTAIDAALRAHLGIARPRVWVCGLNPHAGDGGLLGSEDAAVVAPAVRAAQEAGVDARGPVSAEAAFVHCVRGDGEAVVAMYHDQGLVALKALDFGRTVNWTLGLPFVRTSVDHGTADDIAGRWIADAGSMEAALAWAVRLGGR